MRAIISTPRLYASGVASVGSKGKEKRSKERNRYRASPPAPGGLMMADPLSPPLTLRLLGAFEAYRGAAPLPRLGRRKDQWLLALLALRSSAGGYPAEAARTWL